jgi:hypothetical protein
LQQVFRGDAEQGIATSFQGRRGTGGECSVSGSSSLRIDGSDSAAKGEQSRSSAAVDHDETVITAAKDDESRGIAI